MCIISPIDPEGVQELGMPVALVKLEGPATRISFLGIMLDSEAQILSLPQDKLEDILHRVHSWLGRRSATKHELLSLISRQSFTSKVVPAGRLFLRRLIDMSTTVNRLHHHFRLFSEARTDRVWWARFLPSWHGRAMFLDPEWISASAGSLHLFTDTSGSHDLEHTLMGHGVGDPGCPTKGCPTTTSSGRSFSPSLQPLAPGTAGLQVVGSSSTVTTCQ